MVPLLLLNTGLVSPQLMIKHDRNTERYLLAGVDRFCQLIGKQAANLLVPGSRTKRRSQFTKESHGGWLVNKTALSPHKTKKEKKNGEREEK